MSAVRALVITGPGTNRDPDMSLALRLAGAEPRTVRVDELVAGDSLLESAALAVVAGGFSHGDALGAGRLLALELEVGLGHRLADFVDAGGMLLGVCNGFQVLTRAGLLPGALGHNDSGRFICDWVELDAVADSVCRWTAGLTATVHCPIAHGEGRYVHPDPSALATAGRVALRYAGANPNGSVDAIAGVSDATGRTLGLMPHPENHVLPRQHPRRRHVDAERHLGLHIIANGVRHARR
jgi:phosphoribosylformylglycinamidine synthase